MAAVMMQQRELKTYLLRTYEYLLKKFINLSKKDKLNKLNIYKY